MGIFIYMTISKSVTQCEWEKVYEETLQLVKVFPLAERRKVKCKGIDTICLVPTVERKETYGWNDEKTRLGWFADGDYESLHTAERYSLHKEFFQDSEVESNAGDALLGALPAYMDYAWDDPICSHIYDMWGGKTQAEPYHMYLLAIACIIEARLGEKAFVYGDITRGQCKKAVEMANKYLEIPIDVPDRCDMERFCKRVSKLKMSEKEQLAIFERLYLGTKDIEYGEFIQEKYSQDALNEYWENIFGKCCIGTLMFDDVLKEYLTKGFDLKNLCRVVNYNNEDHVPQYEKFIKRIMDAKLHLENKNCEDILKIDQEESEPYNIYTLMARFTYAGMRNKKIDRYIPIEKLKEVLISELGDKCEVEHIIDEYLQKESMEQDIKISEIESMDELEMLYNQDASEVFNWMMKTKKEIFKRKLEEYDIVTQEDLMYYEKGDSLNPNLVKALRKSFVFYTSITEENTYKELMGKSAEERCRWLIKQNESILIRDRDWNKIFTDIQENEFSFARYYPMMRINLENSNLIYMTIAIVLNDDLYAYCKEIIKETEE